MRNFKKTIVALLFVLSCLLSGLTVYAADPKVDDPVDYNQHIRPILSDKCFFCHGPDKKHRESDLRLDTREGLFGDLGDYAPVVPGAPDESELIARITSRDEDERMPPPDSGKELSAEQIDIIRRWVQQGAAWQQHWAYVPPRRHALPTVKDQKWPLHWIDRFVLARLEAERLAPAPEADRVTLIRRLSFDLIGLPPTPDEVKQFVDDRRADAYERLVDRLLASPHFGERMAMYWLDLVRYADTVGYHGDQDHNISPYRDYVIDAFNENMPFDQFTTEQLAGDLLPDATVDQKIASGYNRLLQTSHEGGVQPKEYLAIYAADRVRNLSGVWMGATMGCTQCHDHKYDPFTMKDFYAMSAFFADIDEAKHFKVGSNSLPTKRPPEIQVISKRDRTRIAKLESQIAELQSTVGKLAADQTANAKQLQQQIKELSQQRDRIKKNVRTTMITVAVKPRTVRVLPRGNWLDDSGPVVEPQVPEFLLPMSPNGGRATRLDLAHWLTDADHGAGGMTARVFANRFWYLFFGTGLAKVLDDFGGQGHPPMHPELLDNLAVEFVESGWDIKHVVKLLVMSRAYRQSSVAPAELLAHDPYNRLIARQSRYRLPAETVRDSALAISGLLIRELGGASVKPYQPSGYYRHLNFPTRKYAHHTDQRQWRRGVYVHWQRQFLHPALKAMDAPSREECTAERPRSNTPLEGLTLLNDPSFVEAARVFAARIVREGGDSAEARLNFACRWCISREPDPVERKLLVQLFASNLQRYKKDPEAARKLIATGQAPRADDLDPVEVAAWTAVSRTLLNLHETITRN